MGKIKVKDNAKKFIATNEVAMDRALNKMQIDIERIAKQTVPHDKGPLHTSGRHDPLGFLKYRVIFNKEYARFQEFGGDGKRVVRNYSKPGKKAHYLGDAGNQVAKNAVQYFQNEARGLKV